MKLDLKTTKYEINGLSKFRRQFKKIIKQGKDVDKFRVVLQILANGEKLDSKYKDHQLNDSKYFSDCRECHIEPDWLLVYKYNHDELILLLIETGSHSDLF